MSETELILADGSGLVLPDAKHPGALALWERASRLPDWLPPGVNARQFLMAVAAEANGLPSNCTPSSVVRCAFNCAVLGLLPGQQLGHAHFVPFKDTSQLIIGYKGLLTLAYQSGFLKAVQCDVVLSGELYRRWNDDTGPRIEHELPLERQEDYGNVQAVYCVWHARTGGRGVAVVPRSQLDAIRKRASRKSPWYGEPHAIIEMCYKTALRRAAKRWQITGRLGMAVGLDDLADVGKAQHALPGPDGQTVESTEPAPTMDDYKGEPFGPDDPIHGQGAEPAALETAATEAATEEEAAGQKTSTGELFDKTPNPGE